MREYLKFLLFISISVLLVGCLPIAADRSAFTVKGEVIDTYGKFLNNCIFSFVYFDDEEGEIKWEDARIESHFYEFGGMAPDPLEALSDTLVEIDCGQGYEVYRSPLLISYKTFSINLGKVVITPTVTDVGITP